MKNRIYLTALTAFMAVGMPLQAADVAPGLNEQVTALTLQVAKLAAENEAKTAIMSELVRNMTNQNTNQNNSNDSETSWTWKSVLLNRYAAMASVATVGGIYVYYKCPKITYGLKWAINWLTGQNEIQIQIQQMQAQIEQLQQQAAQLQGGQTEILQLIIQIITTLQQNIVLLLQDGANAQLLPLPELPQNLNTLENNGQQNNPQPEAEIQGALPDNGNCILC